MCFFWYWQKCNQNIRQSIQVNTTNRLNHKCTMNNRQQKKHRGVTNYEASEDGVEKVRNEMKQKTNETKNQQCSRTKGEVVQSRLERPVLVRRLKIQKYLPRLVSCAKPYLVGKIGELSVGRRVLVCPFVVGEVGGGSSLWTCMSKVERIVEITQSFSQMSMVTFCIICMLRSWKLDMGTGG